MIKPLHLLVSSIVLLLGSFYILAGKKVEAESKLFCAYGRVFVEFHEGPAVWGTIMLDDSGMPLLCPKEVIERNEPHTKGLVL